MPAFLSDSLVDGKLWTVPFARSTAVLYYNKEAFAEAGLDPDKPPKTWDEMVTMGKLLTKKDASGKVTRWGVAIPGSVALAQWMFGALAAENGAKLVNSGGTETYFTDPKVVEALQYWVDLSKVHGIHPPGIQEWGTTPADFLEQRLAMAWTSSGNLANFRANAKFKFGVAPYPGKVTPASVLGGFNIYIFKGAPEASKEAGLKFIKFLTSRDIQADWSVNTGYVATRPDSWETDVMKAYVAKVPEAAIGRDQIKDSVPEISTYENDRVSIKALNDAIAAALTGAKTPEVALGEAQAEAERILKPYR
jgi:sn-glycerol 3-phosphate transport system substrate-binding protein